jgi:hypothetical protein
MIKRITLVVLALLTFFMYSNSQIVQNPDSLIKYEKARYLKQDLYKFLSTHTEYPYTEMMSMLDGDVVFSFNINRDGKLESLALKDYSDASFINNSKNAISLLDGEWSPTKLNDAPVEQKYILVFRYRTYVERKPYDCRAESRKLIEKQKFEKALKTLNSGIEDNKYDYELYELRSQAKEKLGDNEGAKDDQLNSLRLKVEVMSVIDVTSMVVRRTVKMGETVITGPPRTH